MTLAPLLRERNLLFDGAKGTSIQACHLTAEDCSGAQYRAMALS